MSSGRNLSYRDDSPREPSGVNHVAKIVRSKQIARRQLQLDRRTDAHASLVEAAIRKVKSTEGGERRLAGSPPRPQCRGGGFVGRNLVRPIRVVEGVEQVRHQF